MKGPLLQDKKALARLLERINSDPQFQPHLRKDEPDWSLEISKLGLSPGMEQELISSLKLLWILPFADLPVVKGLLLFRYLELPKIEERFDRVKDSKGKRLCALYLLLLKMLLQGNSIAPQSATHLANRLHLLLKAPSAESDPFLPLLDLFVDESAAVRMGKNFVETASLDLVILSEHQRREGAAESGWRNNKFDLYRQELLENREFLEDWNNLKRRFKLEKFRDSRGIIRRSAIPERNWQRPTHPEMEVTKDQFQTTFDFFCWKWFLYGMCGDEPLIEKLTVTLTPYGTQIFVPGYWSLDAARDINWGRVQRLHKARGIPKQGRKAAQNAKERNEQLGRLKNADKEARRRGLKGAARYAFLKQLAGLAGGLDDSQVRRMLREFSKYSGSTVSRYSKHQRLLQ